MEKFINQIIQGDCLNLMKKIPDNLIDFCFTDPPYNVGKNYIGYKDNLEDELYLEWSKKFLNEIKRVSKNCCILVPTKFMRHYWLVLGENFLPITLTRSTEGGFGWGYTRQCSYLLCNKKPLNRCRDWWHNLQMRGMGFFFREDHFNHPGYTSEELTKKVLHHFTKENDLVLDPFSGTGTLPVCCHQLKRRFICFEKEKKYVELSNERLEQERSQMTLF